MVPDKAKEVAEICKRRGVRRLALFGSAATGTFDSASSDLDFLVEFAPLGPAQHADSYFGLQEDLERLFSLPVELVDPDPSVIPTSSAPLSGPKSSRPPLTSCGPQVVVESVKIWAGLVNGFERHLRKQGLPVNRLPVTRFSMPKEQFVDSFRRGSFEIPLLCL